MRDRSKLSVNLTPQKTWVSEAFVGKTDTFSANGLAKSKENQIRLDERFIYSASGTPYPRRSPRNIREVSERRLPFVRVIKAKGKLYYYFALDRLSRVPLPDINDPGFDHAYLSELAAMEGKEGPQWAGHVNSFVYFIQAETGQIKIGLALSPERRLEGLQCGSPVKLRIAATVRGIREVEQSYHRQFAAHRLHGEWFSPAPEILAEIARLHTGAL